MASNWKLSSYTSLLIFVYVFFMFIVSIFTTSGVRDLLECSDPVVWSFHIDRILLLLFCQSAILTKILWNRIQLHIRAPRDLSFLSLLLISHLFILWFVIFRFLPRNLNFQWRWTMARRTTLPHSFDFHFFIFAVVQFLLFRDSWE